MIGNLSYLWALIRCNMRFYKTEYWRLFIMSSFMMIQNFMFFILWIILFSTAKELKGWNMADIARMSGIIASAVGISLFFFNGSRQIAYKIQDGSLDSFIARPRAVLPSLMLSSTSSASLGDIFYGPLMWLFFGDVTWAQVPILISVTLISSVIFSAMTVIVFSIAFWMKSEATRFTEQMFLVLIIISCSMPHGQPEAVQWLMKTILPAWYVIYLPTELVKNFDIKIFAGLIGAAIIYASAAALIFKAGLRRYINSLT